MSGSILVLSGLDPCGGAGISADIETIHQFGLVALPIITTLTVQNTATIESLKTVDTNLITAQFNHLQQDIDFDVVKIGLLSSSPQIKTIANLIKGKTLVLDPIIKASTGVDFLDKNMIAALKKHLLPLTKIITPNQAELFVLSGENDEQKAVEKLACEWTLITRTEVCENAIEHRLYHQTQFVEGFTYDKLSGKYHGSGCTLSSAISALLSLGVDVQSACRRALDYTHQTLLNAKSVGKMQYHPNRIKPL